MPRILELSIIICIALMTAGIHAQQREYLSRFISTDHGLPDRTVIGIAEDNSGHMWFAGAESLTRYDGYDFDLFNPALTSGEQIESCLPNQNGGVLFGTTNGRLFHISPEGNTTEIHNPQIKVRESPQCTWSDNGSLWLYYPQNGLLVLLDSELNIDQTMSVRRFWDERPLTRATVIASINDRVAILAGENSIYSYNLDGQLIDSMIRTEINMPEGFRSVQSGVEGSFWVMSGSRLTRVSHALEIDPASSIDWTATEHIAFMETRNNGLVLADYSTAVRIYEASGDLRRLNLEPQGYAVNWVPIRDVFESSSGELWFATRVGVFVVHRREQPFRSIDIDGDPDRPVAGLGVRGMYCHEDGRLFFNTDAVPFFELLKVDGEFHAKRNAPNVFGSMAFYSLVRKGNNLIARGSSYDLSSGDVVLGENRSTGYEYLDNNGSLWTWSKPGGEIFIENPDAAGFKLRIDPGSEVLQITGGFQDRIWVSTTTGLRGFNFQGELIEDFSSASWTEYPVLKRQINCVIEHAEDKLIAGTKSGIILIDRKNNEEELTSIGQGLSHPMVYSLLMEGDSAVWVGTGNGLCRFRISNHEITCYNTTHGIAHNEFNRFAATTDSSGWYYMGGIDGISVFRPDDVVDYTSRQSMSDLMLLELSKYDGEHTRSLLSDLHQNAGIVLDPGDRILSIEVGLTSYVQSNANTFSFFLDGYDEGWSRSGADNSIRYSSIPHGSYTLRVRGKDIDGRQAIRELAIPVTVRQAFYTTTWFFIFCMIFVAGVVYLLLTVRYHRKLQIERIRTKLASDLHDEVGGLLSGMAMQMDLIEDEVPESLKSKVQRIGRASRDAVLRMKDVIWTVDDRRNTTGDLIDRLRAFASEVLEPLDMSYVFQEGGIDRSRKLKPLVRENLYFICKEAITNAAKHSGAKTVTVKIIESGKGITLSVEDDGTGFDRSGTGVGQGLENLQLRADRINATLRIDHSNGTSVQLVMR